MSHVSAAYIVETCLATASVVGVRTMDHRAARGAATASVTVPWTGQPRRTTSLERLGSHSDTQATTRLTTGRITCRAVGLAITPSHGTLYTLGRGQCYPSGRATRGAAHRTNYCAMSKREQTVVRSGIRLGQLESTHYWTGQLRQRFTPAPARTCNHTWVGTRPADEGQLWMERTQEEEGDSCEPSQDWQGPRYGV